MKEIKILLADDHNVLRQGLAEVLNAQPDLAVVAQARTGREACRLAAEVKPDVILMDINMPELDGVAATWQISAELPQTGIIILTMYRRDEYVFEAIKAGASGYLLKEVELDELLAGIRAVAQGQAIIDTSIAVRLLNELRQPGQYSGRKGNNPVLAARDLEILQLVAQGLSNQEIANRLSLSEKTIRNRLSLVFRQLQIENRTQAALYALRKGLIDEKPDDNG